MTKKLKGVWIFYQVERQLQLRYITGYIHSEKRSEVTFFPLQMRLTSRAYSLQKAKKTTLLTKATDNYEQDKNQRRETETRSWIVREGAATCYSKGVSIQISWIFPLRILFPYLFYPYLRCLTLVHQQVD